MRKPIIALIAALTLGLGARAQDFADMVAGRGGYSGGYDAAVEALPKHQVKGTNTYIRLGYVSAQTSGELSPRETSSYGFFLQNGHTYFVGPTLGGIVRFGIDAIWFDINAAKYEQARRSVFDDDYGYWDCGDGGGFDIGRWTVTGSMGLGASATAAPFGWHDSKGLRALRAKVYFHYKPSVGLCTASADGETELAVAFCNLYECGGMISWKAIGLGIEGSWGSGKFKPMEFDPESGPGLGGKYLRRFASTRFYISFNF